MHLRKLLLLCALLVISVSFIAADGSHPSAPTVNLNPAQPINRLPQPAVGRDEEEILFSEDFEDGMEGWESGDFSVVAWHKTDLFGGANDLLWWCGDTLGQYDGEPVGYDNAWLQYLQTPVMDLSDAGNQLKLSFDAYWLLEDPRIKPPAAPHNGYDGWFVMLSENGGAEFKVIKPIAPNYTSTRVKAAEVYWGMGGEVPGWVFHSGQWADTNRAVRPNVQWVQCSFDLAAYAGKQDVVIRFVLASDGSVAAPYGNIYLQDRSGVFIDNILISDGESVFLEDTGEDEPIGGELVASIDPKYGGDHWARTDTDAHESTWSMWNDDDHLGANNFLISPEFEIPQDYTAWYDYWVHCDLPDSVSAGSQALNDFYQNYITKDNGATWTYKNHDYSRPLAGGAEWTHYTWNLPFGNRDLYLNDYAGETIRIMWLFRTNRVNNPSGTGLFIDDIKVTGVNAPRWDASIDSFHVPYPTTVGYRIKELTAVVKNEGLEDFTNLNLRWGYTSTFANRSIPILPKPSLLADSSKFLTLSDLRDGANTGWTPTAAGHHNVFIVTKLDDDGKPENDSISHDPLHVWPSGLYELGYDNRTAQLAFAFEANKGPAVRFTPATNNLQEYSIAAAKFKFNGGQQGNASATLHIYSEQQEGVPGAKLLSVPIVVPPDSTHPNTFTVSLADKAELRGLNTPFWFYLELGANAPRPQIIGDKRYWGAGRYHQWNGASFVPYDQGDLLIQALVVPTAEAVPDLAVSTEMIDFGKITIDSMVFVNFSFYSKGLAPVTITNVSCADASFDIDWPRPVTLKTGESVSIVVAFTPAGKGIVAAALGIQSDDQTPPEVDLTGEGIELSVQAGEGSYPAQFGIAEPYPNPFNSTTRVNFTLSQAGWSRLALYDLGGRMIKTISSGVLPAGKHTALFDGKELPAGVYLIRLETADKTAVRKVVLLK